MLGFDDSTGWTQAFFSEWWESIVLDLKTMIRRKVLYGGKQKSARVGGRDNQGQNGGVGTERQDQEKKTQ